MVLKPFFVCEVGLKSKSVFKLGAAKYIIAVILIDHFCQFPHDRYKKPNNPNQRFAGYLVFGRGPNPGGKTVGPLLSGSMDQRQLANAKPHRMHQEYFPTAP